MKKIIFILIIFPGLSYGAFRSDYITATSSATTQGEHYIETYVPPTSKPTVLYSGFTFDGTDWCLYVNGSEKECWTQALQPNYVLLEDSTNFLLEDGTSRLKAEVP